MRIHAGPQSDHSQLNCNIYYMYVFFVASLFEKVLTVLYLLITNKIMYSVFCICQLCSKF